MPLDPQLQAIRDQLEKENAPRLYTMSIPAARAADLEAVRAGAGHAEPVARVTDRLIPGPATDLPIRIYWPDRPGPWPLLVYFFGGGWSLGTIDTCDGVCRKLTNAAGCVTVAAGYRLAPEHKFPAAVHDCHAATSWVAAHAADLGADAERLAVGGDSAGGNLAAASEPAGIAAARGGSDRAATSHRDHRGVRSAARRGRGVRHSARSRRRPGEPHPIRGNDSRLLHHERSSRPGQDRGDVRRAAAFRRVRHSAAPTGHIRIPSSPKVGDRAASQARPA